MPKMEGVLDYFHSSKRHKPNDTEMPAESAQSSDCDDPQVLREQLTALNHQCGQFSEKYELLKAEVAAKDTQIAKLKQKISTAKKTSNHPTDDELAKELRDLYHDIYKWTMKIKRGLGCDLVINNKGQPGYEMLDSFMPLLKTGGPTYARHALITHVTSVLLKSDMFDTVSKPDLSYFGSAFQEVGDTIYDPEKYADFKEWQNLTKHLVLAIDPGAIDKSIDSRARQLCFELQGVLGFTTSIQPNESVLQTLFPIARSAVTLLAKFSFHPAKYGFYWHVAKNRFNFKPHASEACSGYVPEAVITGFVFPGLIKIKDESGKPIGQTIIAKAMVITEPRQLETQGAMKTEDGQDPEPDQGWLPDSQTMCP